MSNNWRNWIYNHEEPPPINAWENIAKQLDTIEGKTTVNTKANKSKVIYWRIAAAACITAITTTTFIWLNNDNKNNVPGNNIATNIVSNNKPSENIKQNTTSNSTAEDVKIASTANNTALIQKNKRVNLQNDKNNLAGELQYAKEEIVRPLTNNPGLNKAEKLVGSRGNIINDIALMISPNSYVSFFGPNGQEIKVSSKFSNLIGYMDGKDPEAEENLDKIVSEGNFWRGKFKNWRNKMINNSIAPSPANFMNIIELSKLLTEE